MNYTLESLGIELDSLPNEQWRYVANTNNRYLVSNMGRLLTTGYRGSKRCSIMKPAKDANGYYRTMMLLNGKLKTIKLHRVVAEAWIENPLNKLQVNHINFERDDNRVSNLEWATPKENSYHSKINGRFLNNGNSDYLPLARGSKNGMSKLNEEQVKEIRQKFKPRIYTREMLAKEYGVSHHTIKDAILRRWKHVQ